MYVTAFSGDASVVAAGQRKPAKVDERVRADAGYLTARRSALTVEFENGSVLKLGSNSEVAVDEFWQQPHSQAGKAAEWKEEPSASRTKLRLVRGDLSLTVLPLKTQRGSSCTLELIAGNITITRGILTAQVQMTELGLGICLLELRDGAAEFEPVGGAAKPLPVGRRVALAVEVDARTGAVRVTDAPKPDAGRK